MRCHAPKTKAHLERFARDESGVATIFACFMIMMMVLVGGIGVDLMHNEMERTRMQNTLDRAVLAAADLDQTLSPEDVVKDYFVKSGMGDRIPEVRVEGNGTNNRIVTARAATTSPVQFMHLMGVNSLPVRATTQAVEGISDVEISLVLDISGSMGRNQKMKNLRQASTTFSQLLLNNDTRDKISLSIVPYSEHVSVGPDLFEELSVNQRHGYSHCIDLPESAYNTVRMDTSQTQTQLQHFQWFDSWANNVDNNPNCPTKKHQQITTFTQNRGEVQRSIGKLSSLGNTATYQGVKWAAALLDPSMRPVVQRMASKRAADTAFIGRPAAYDDPETLKTIVLMSDGRNTESYRIKEAEYDTQEDIDHWRQNNLFHYLRNNVPTNEHDDYYYLKTSRTKGDNLLGQICSAAKDKGIVIWTVGFEIDDHGANVLEACASSPSHFFRVEGADLEDAFRSIALQVRQLRLTQ